MEPEPPRFARVFWHGRNSALFAEMPDWETTFVAKPADTKWWDEHTGSGWIRLERNVQLFAGLTRKQAERLADGWDTSHRPFDDRLQVAIRLGRIEGRYVVTGLHVETDGELAQRSLRTIPLADIARAFESEPDSVDEPPPLDIESQRRPGRRARPDSFYADVAKWHRKALVEAPSRPVQWMALRLGGVNSSTVHRWLTKAKELGYLDEAGVTEVVDASNVARPLRPGKKDRP